MIKITETFITEIWDDDCGWRYFCGLCGKNVHKKDDECPHCNARFKGTERV